MDTTLSPEARRALMNYTARRGAPAPQGANSRAQEELLRFGYINTRENLTQRGADVREQLINEALEAL